MYFNSAIDGSNLNLLLVQMESSCNFFDSFGILVQTILGIITLGILMCKRYIEKPRRSWKVWFYDTSKQVVGQLTQHFINLFLSYGLGRKNGHECEFYILNIINDVTIGVFICYLYIKLFEYILKDSKIAFKSGDYGEDSSFAQYVYQLFIWIIIVVISKLTNSLIMIISSRFLEIIGVVMLLPFRYNIKVKFIFVMIIYPMIFTALQFWVTDNIIKYSENNESIKNLSENNDKEYKKNQEMTSDPEYNKTEKNELHVNLDNDSITKPLLEKV